MSVATQSDIHTWMGPDEGNGPSQTLQEDGVEPLGTAAGSSGNGMRYLKLP